MYPPDFTAPGQYSKAPRSGLYCPSARSVLSISASHWRPGIPSHNIFQTFNSHILNDLPKLILTVLKVPVLVSGCKDVSMTPSR